MRTPVDSSALAEVTRVLEGLSETVASVEDDLLSCLVVMGEPRAQHTVDAWVDQVVDLVRAIGADEQPRPSFPDALAVQRVLDAVERSAADRSTWTGVR